MKTRVISGITVAVLAIGLVWIGGYTLAVALCAVSVIAYLELTKATRVRLDDNKLTGMEKLGIIAIVVYYLLLVLANEIVDLDVHYYMLVIILGLLILMMLTYVFTYPKYKAYQVMNSYFAFVYGPVMLSFVYMTRSISNHLDTEYFTIGFFAAFLCFLSWLCDTCAYFAGVTLGKHKAFPKLSPKKTIEGCLGGLIGCGLVGLLYGFVLHYFEIIAVRSVVLLGVLGVVGGAVGMVGDLAASAIKRNFEIKDYGNIIPGHGGIMDRFDSMIMIAPFIYALSKIVFK